MSRLSIWLRDSFGVTIMPSRGGLEITSKLFSIFSPVDSSFILKLFSADCRSFIFIIACMNLGLGLIRFLKLIMRHADCRSFICVHACLNLYFDLICVHNLFVNCADRRSFLCACVCLTLIFDLVGVNNLFVNFADRRSFRCACVCSNF